MSLSTDRRRMLKGGVAGAAALWATPVVTGLGITPAAAASGGRSCPTPVITAFQGDIDFQFEGQLLSGTDLTQNSTAFSSDTTGFIFNESPPVQIGPGGYQSETEFIPEGTWVCSIYIHASPSTATTRYRATISVPGSVVLGYDGRTSELENSDPMFAVSGVDYDGAARGHEWRTNPNNQGDFYRQIAPDTIEIRMSIGNCCTDHSRLFVACV